MSERDSAEPSASSELPGFDPAAGPFEIFSFPRRYELDEAALERRLLELSRRYHPDRAGSDSGARARATLLVAQVNDAYALLSDRFQRAEWLLGALGGSPSSEDKSVPEGFLEHMLEIRMELWELGPEDETRIDELEDRHRRELRDALSVVGEVFAHLETNAVAEGERDGLLRRVRRRLNEAAYHRSVLRDLDERRA